MQSVSSQLEMNLVLKSVHPAVGQSLSPGLETGIGTKTTASEYLLKAQPGLSNKNRSTEGCSFAPYKVQKKNDSPVVDPLLHQISQSSVDKPKYWNSSGKRVKKVVKSQSLTATKKRHQRGEDYNDRLKQKVEIRKKK